MSKRYKSQAARDAQAAGYGDRDYWDYLDRSSQEHFDYYMKRGDKKKAREMMTQNIGEALTGNDGD